MANKKQLGLYIPCQSNFSVVLVKSRGKKVYHFYKITLKQHHILRLSVTLLVVIGPLVSDIILLCENNQENDWFRSCCSSFGFSVIFQTVELFMLTIVIKCGFITRSFQSLVMHMQIMRLVRITRITRIMRFIVK